MNLKKTLKPVLRKFMYYPGWQTSRKIVVIESDDWGSISLPSKEVYNQLLSSGVKVDKDPYCKYDGLAEPEDLSKLFDVLTSYRDKNERNPVITANTVVANPDFSKIRDADFKEYHYEVFTETLKKGDQTASSFDLWKEGISKKIFFPQFHGREHLQISDWMNALRAGNKHVLKAFDLGAFGIPVADKPGRRRNDFRAAFDYNSEEGLEDVKLIVKDGLTLFEELFGFRSHSIIAPCYTWMRELEPTLSENGIFYLQGIAFQQEPGFDQNSYNRRYNYLGKQNKYGQLYGVRNAFFEPNLHPDITNPVEKTMQRINEIFKLNKPAIIGSHRLNFIGSMKKGRRDTNLKLFSELMESMLKEWPEIEFMSTAELGNLIAERRKKTWSL